MSMLAPTPAPFPPLTIPKRQRRDAALDHQALFAAGLGHVQQLARRLWTDHNVHDPGITTLELLCYALSDLGYRASFPIEDLLASKSENAKAMADQFHTARTILTTRPVTTADYRKLLIDLVGVKNAWVRPTTQIYYADTIRGALLREPPAAPTGIIPVSLRGLYEVLIEYMDDVDSDAERERVLGRARDRLQANRNLCEDFVRFAEVGIEEFILCAELELAPEADVARTHAEILFTVQDHLSPLVHQYRLTEMLARTRPDGTRYSSDEIFDGPPLDHGFIDEDELAQSDLRTEVRLSDVISVIMDVDGVRAVRDVVINPMGADAALENKWVVPVTPGRAVRLNRDASRLVFYKRNMPFVARREDFTTHWNRLAAAARQRVEAEAPDDLPIPLGSYRDPGAYYSFQNHFPAVYGLSEAGLVGLATEPRHALAFQLKAYLLFFDQVMADFLAQLARVRDLFSIDAGLTATYFHQVVDSFVEFERIYSVKVADLAAAMEERADDRTAQIDRRNRFLDHLIARVAERFHDFVQVMRSEFGSSDASMIRDKCEFLRDYPAVSGARALGYDDSRQDDAALWNSGNISGLEKRVSRLLGIRRSDRRNLGEIAYDIYAEIDDTPGNEFRFRIRRRDSGKILLSSTTRYATSELAREEMRRAIRAASVPSGFQRKVAADATLFFNIVDDKGEVLAQRKEYFHNEDARNAAIDELMEYVRREYSDEGMYLIESILLRPRDEGDPFLPICPDPNCADCADEDPYSYRIHVILPAYAGRFHDMEFRRWSEAVIREETPAHIQPKICWISAQDMAELEKLYRDWIYLRAGRETADRGRKLTDFIRKLFDVKSVYPAQNLHECDAPEEQKKFILGQAALGTRP